MNTEQTGKPSTEGRKAQTELQNRYGRIALSAVAAALPYGTGSKKTAGAGAESAKADAHN